MAQLEKIVGLDKFGDAESKDFAITSNKNETFEVLDKNGNQIAKYDAVRAEVKVCKVHLEAAGAPFTIKFADNEVALSAQDADDVSNAEVI